MKIVSGFEQRPSGRFQVVTHMDPDMAERIAPLLREDGLKWPAEEMELQARACREANEDEAGPDCPAGPDPGTP